MQAGLFPCRQVGLGRTAATGQVQDRRSAGQAQDRQAKPFAGRQTPCFPCRQVGQGRTAATGSESSVMQTSGPGLTIGMPSWTGMMGLDRGVLGVADGGSRATGLGGYCRKGEGDSSAAALGGDALPCFAGCGVCAASSSSARMRMGPRQAVMVARL